MDKSRCASDNGNSTEKIGAETVFPYNSQVEKGKQVEQMFDSIAPAYDFMNNAMTFGLHRLWRDKAINMAVKILRKSGVDKDACGVNVLDVATGTGDVAFALARRLPYARITGIDLSTGMLGIARKKRVDMDPSVASRISFETGDCLNLQFPDNSFSLLTVAYGVRNFQQLSDGLKEMCRVLRPGGVVCIIELSCPEGKLARLGYDIYSGYIIPAVGRLISGDHSAYKYLPKSIAAAPQRSRLTSLMENAGFKKCRYKSLTLGVITIYLAEK